MVTQHIPLYFLHSTFSFSFHIPDIMVLGSQRVLEGLSQTGEEETVSFVINLKNCYVRQYFTEQWILKNKTTLICAYPKTQFIHSTQSLIHSSVINKHKCQIFLVPSFSNGRTCFFSLFYT